MDINKKLFRTVITVFFILTSVGCGNAENSNQVYTGADILLSEKFSLIKNKRLGIVTNHTALLKNGTHLVDTLFARDDVEIVTLFGPEHGIRGNAPDGHSIQNGTDVKTGLPVISLYGKIRKPTKEMLQNIDVLIFDIQDVGARFYTFISTMFYAIQSAAENNIPIIILDRPNPINGINVNGPILDPKFKSFVGIAEIPIRHGMTVGELALFFNRTEVLNTEKTADLKIIKMKNWQRNFFFDDCELKWIKTSPNIPNLETAIVYPGLCLLEGTNISEGRGTYSPFIQFGSPFINSEDVINELNNLGIDGCELISTKFTPKEIKNMASSPKYEGELCNGIKINLKDRNLFVPIDFAVKLIFVIHKLYPEKFSFRENRIDRLWGNSSFRDMINNNPPDKILNSFENDLSKFKILRKQFLLY